MCGKGVRGVSEALPNGLRMELLGVMPGADNPGFSTKSAGAGPFAMSPAFGLLGGLGGNGTM